MTRIATLAALAAVLAGPWSTAPCAEPLRVELGGYFEAEGRGFFERPSDPRQFEHLDGSVAFQPELYGEWGRGDVSFTVIPFVRADAHDPNRTHVDLRELAVQLVFDRLAVKAGVSRVFWGVTESQHLVDVINQTDLVENIDGEDKLGQPMVNLSWITDDLGTFNLFYLPYFRERTYPSATGRLRLIPRIDPGRPVFEAEQANWHPDFALRWAAALGDFDVGLHYFNGTSRDPLLQPARLPSGEQVLRPVYNLMGQWGTDIQWTRGSWLWKLEAFYRSGKGQDFEALAGGFEHTLYGVSGTAIDVGLIAEYHHDGRGDDALTALNHDLFAGLRFAFNDVQSTSLLTGVFYDPRFGTTSARLELERRLGSRHSLIVEGQWFQVHDRRDILYSVRNDSFIQVAIRTYF